MRLYRVLVFDQFSPTTHSFFNGKLLCILSQMNCVERVIFIAHSRVISEIVNRFRIPKAKLISIDQIFQIKSRFQREYQKFRFIKNISSEFLPTHIVFSSFENLTFSLFNYMLPNVPNICFLHYNLDDLNSGRFKVIKRLLLSLQQWKSDFIVFEDFLKEQLSAITSIDHNKIHVIQHPIEKYHEEINLQNQFFAETSVSARFDRELLIFIPSGSSDFQVIEQLMNNKEFKNLRCKFYSKYYKEVNLDWFIAKPYFSREEYLKLMREADLIYVPYAKQVGYRISGPILDSIYCKKYILVNENPFTRFISEKYPYTLQIIKSIPSYDDIKNIYEIRKKHLKEYKESWRRFVQDHSDENISINLMNLLDKTFYRKKTRSG